MHVKVRVVSLSDAHARRAAFASHAAATRLDWRFFDACRGLTPHLTYDEAAARVHKGRALTTPEIACYASHYTLWRELLEDECDGYVVLEDDTLVDWPFIERLCDEDLPALGIEYLRLYHVMPSRSITRIGTFLRNNTKVIELLDHPYGTQGYLITRACAQRFVDAFATITRPIDDQMDRHWEHGTPNLAVFPFPIVEVLGASTINAGRASARPEQTLRRRLYQARDRVAKRLGVARRRRAALQPG